MSFSRQNNYGPFNKVLRTKYAGSLWLAHVFYPPTSSVGEYPYFFLKA